MIIAGIKRTRIIHELPPKRELSVSPDLARRMNTNSLAGLSIGQIAARLGISKSVVAQTLAALSSLAT